MRKMAVVGVLAILVCQAFAAPITGTYKSPDAGGDFLNGRWSESYVGGHQGAVGNTINAASWDGSALGTEWTAAGQAISVPPTLVYDSVVNGFGQRVYQTTYDGGLMTLKASGPWNSGSDADYLVDIDTYSHTTTMVLMDNQVVTFITTAFLTGTFQGYAGYEVRFAIGAAMPYGMNASSLPTGYPAFLGTSAGDYGVVQKITMEIVPEPVTLMTLCLGAAGLIRRRQRR